VITTFKTDIMCRSCGESIFVEQKRYMYDTGPNYASDRSCAAYNKDGSRHRCFPKVKIFSAEEKKALEKEILSRQK